MSRDSALELSCLKIDRRIDSTAVEVPVTFLKNDLNSQFLMSWFIVTWAQSNNFS